MKKSELLVFVCVLLSIVSCTKVELSEQIIGSWEVVSLQLDDSSAEIEATDTYFVTFKDDGNYSFETDFNTCDAAYSCDDDGNFSSSGPGCTKVGGDSDFSQAIIEVFRKNLTLFEIKGRTLIIEGDGFVELKKVKDE